MLLTDYEVFKKDENEHEDIFFIKYSGHKRTEKLGYDVEIRNLLANDCKGDVAICWIILGLLLKI